MFEDEFNGVGGSYVIDEKTGKRKLVEQTAEADKAKPAPAETVKEK